MKNNEATLKELNMKHEYGQHVTQTLKTTTEIALHHALQKIYQKELQNLKTLLTL